MNIKTTLILLISTLLLVRCAIPSSVLESQIEPEPEPQIPYCSAVYITPATYKAVTEDLVIYAGDKEINKGWLETREIVTSPPTRKWSKQKEANCESLKEEDCFTLVSEEEGLMLKSYTILNDTTYISDYEIWTVTGHQLNNNSTSKNITILCEKEIPTNLMESIQRRLVEEGYYRGMISGVLDLDSKVALMNYQESGGLPTAGLDIDTLERLGIDWKAYY